jgi:predicted class III extradiol MEMO1 family dioxygenase
VDWKPYYQAECRTRGAREAIERWLVADSEAARAVKQRAVLSFPHTALRYAGPLQGRVARALYDDSSVERVLALGVLHAGGLEMYRTALDEAAPRVRRAEAFAKVRGAFLSRETSVETPLGAVPTWRAEETEFVRADRVGLLAAEFSLDTFHSVLRVAADALCRPPLPVLAVYVGMTRDPVSGSLEVAGNVADWLAAQVDSSTAVVATGDLIHYGTAYGGAWIPGNPTSTETLGRVLRPAIEVALAGAFVAGDLEAAYQLSRGRLANDQREMLAVISSYLGARASFSLLAFELSDYAEILGVAPPCVVASALALYSSTL